MEPRGRVLVINDEPETCATCLRVLQHIVSSGTWIYPWAPQILALLGLFDNWFDFRKWAEPPNEGE